MYRYFDKIILFLLCSILYMPINNTQFNVVYLLIALIVASITGYFDQRYLRYLTVFAYFVFTCFFSEACYFIPLILYDSIYETEFYWLTLFLIPYFIHYPSMQSYHLIVSFCFILCALYLRKKTDNISEIQHSNKKIKDDSVELQLLQEQKNKELLERQDYEIQLAKAEERNRIAREIHDSVGHNLSSSLLQIGAMIAINTDEEMKQPLQNMRNTLEDGMDSIRNSVHDLHNDTLLLRTEMEKLIAQFQFCAIHLQYSCKGFMDIKLKYCFINILKEALNNVIKHSNATLVEVSFIENPGFYQFTIHDNGNTFIDRDGLGMKSIYERVYSFDGICSITKTHGFKIFINIPKEVMV